MEILRCLADLGVGLHLEEVQNGRAYYYSSCKNPSVWYREFSEQQTGLFKKRSLGASFDTRTNPDNVPNGCLIYGSPFVNMKADIDYSEISEVLFRANRFLLREMVRERGKTCIVLFLKDNTITMIVFEIGKVICTGKNKYRARCRCMTKGFDLNWRCRHHV